MPRPWKTDYNKDNDHRICMSGLNPRINTHSLSQYEFAGESGRTDQAYRQAARTQTKNAYSQQRNEDMGASKTSYKYAFYKDRNENEFNSRHSVSGNDSLQMGAALGRPPSFRKLQPARPSILDSIQNVMQSHRSKHSQSSQQLYQIQSEEILFLKQKLIETHNKLLKELQHSNRLSLQLETTNNQIEMCHRDKKQLIGENEELRKEIEKFQFKLDKQYQKREETQKSIETKYQEEMKKSAQLKQDLESMRKKMLETIVQKNNCEEKAHEFRGQLGSIQQAASKLRQQVKDKDQQVEYLTKELQIARKRLEKADRQCSERGEEIHQYNHLAAEREQAIKHLEHELKLEKEKSGNLLSQYATMQSEYKSLSRKIDEFEALCEQLKDQNYWLKTETENRDKQLKASLEKANHEINALNARIKQKEKQVENMRRKPQLQAEKKKKNYENTREFVNRLETEQSMIGHSRSTARALSRPNNSPSAKSQKNLKKRPNLSPRGGLENPITHEPLPYAQAEYNEEKNKSFNLLNHIGDLETNLLAYNMEKKKMLTDMDKIDDTKVKTREMITKRRKLEQQVKQQELKIKRVKDQLRKAKAI